MTRDRQRHQEEGAGRGSRLDRMSGRRIGLRPSVVLLVSLLTGVTHAGVVINEIHYAPADASPPGEFVELHNPDSDPVDLSGWSFTKGISYTFPPGTTLGAGAYLVVAKSPENAASQDGDSPVVGPFRGRLANEGERLQLCDRQGNPVDEVDYGVRFPWPVLDRGAGASIELLHPRLDNSLGGSWRRSGSGAEAASGPLIPSGSRWRVHKGTSEPSSILGVWRRPGFDDGDWPEGNAPIGYGEPEVATSLVDMRGRYSTVYLRKSFDIASVDGVQTLDLEVRYDDGFNAWINGVHVASANVPSSELPHTATALRAIEPGAYDAFPLPRPSLYLRPGENVLALQLLNSSLARSSDAFLDLRLLRGRAGTCTPGARNSVLSDTPPIYARKAKHTPREPRSHDPVTLTLKVTSAEEIASVVAEYQPVDPGFYVSLDDPAYSTGWRRIELNDSGTHGDAEAGDAIYSAVVPGHVQRHRRLVRYRFVVKARSGQTLEAPGRDDPRSNFAYFVYDGVPAWKGAIQPGLPRSERGRVVTYPSEVLERIPVYHLITKKSDAEAATWRSRYRGSEYRWRGTLVYDGEVYDHIGYRARGGVWRYSMGKNMWKFDFHRGQRFEARDDHGRKYRERWDKLNLSAVIQQGDTDRRGEQGLFESVGYRLFNLAGVSAPKTHFVHFRIIDDFGEAGPTQYDGDFWGLYLAVEQMDGRFLDEHGLADGNLYKMERGRGELQNAGFGQPSDGSDLREFVSVYPRASRDAWWRQNFDLPGYYSFRAIVEGIHHYDIGDGKNYFYFHDVDSGKWSIFPWDIDLTWADHMFGSGVDPFVRPVLRRDVFRLEFRNRVREIRDLLFNAEQVGQLIDEHAALIDDPAGGVSIVDADRARWDYAPVMSDWSRLSPAKTRPGLFYRGSPTGDFEGMARLMKDYARRTAGRLDRIAYDPAVPERPRLEYAGPPGFPADAVELRTGPFSDPQGSDTFGAMKWRVADVTQPEARPTWPPAARRYEIESAWESAEETEFQDRILIPPDVLIPNRTYRARACVMDDTGRWSHWSAPVEFQAGDRNPKPQTPNPEE